MKTNTQTSQDPAAKQIDAIIKFIGDKVPIIGKDLEPILQLAKTGVLAAKAVVFDIPMATIKAITEGVNKLTQFSKEQLGKMQEYLKKQLTELKKKLEKVWEKFTKQVKALPEKAWNVIKAGFEALAIAITACILAIVEVTKFIASIPAKIASIPGKIDQALEKRTLAKLNNSKSIPDVLEFIHRNSNKLLTSVNKELAAIEKKEKNLKNGASLTQDEISRRNTLLSAQKALNAVMDVKSVVNQVDIKNLQGKFAEIKQFVNSNIEAEQVNSNKLNIRTQVETRLDQGILKLEQLIFDQNRDKENNEKDEINEKDKRIHSLATNIIAEGKPVTIESLVKFVLAEVKSEQHLGVDVPDTIGENALKQTIGSQEFKKLQNGVDVMNSTTVKSKERKDPGLVNTLSNMLRDALDIIKQGILRIIGKHRTLETFKLRAKDEVISKLTEAKDIISSKTSEIQQANQLVGKLDEIFKEKGAEVNEVTDKNQLLSEILSKINKKVAEIYSSENLRQIKDAKNQSNGLWEKVAEIQEKSAEIAAKALRKAIGQNNSFVNKFTNSFNNIFKKENWPQRPITKVEIQTFEKEYRRDMEKMLREIVAGKDKSAGREV